jgi:hypothetical protein
MDYCDTTKGHRPHSTIAVQVSGGLVRRNIAETLQSIIKRYVETISSRAAALLFLFAASLWAKKKHRTTIVGGGVLVARCVHAADG